MSLKKTVHRLLAAAAALVMAFTVVTPAFAAMEGTAGLETGTITINNAIPGQTYSIYQVLYLESYNAKAGAYSYKANSSWSDWVQNPAGGAKYLVTNDQGYVTWREDADVEAFVKDALAYAQAHSILSDASQSAGNAVGPNTTTTVTFTDLKPGYYLVDTTTGSLCSVDTTQPDAVIDEKNQVPAVTKQVQEDSTNSFGDANSAQIGDTVNFQTTITAHKGAQNYVLHDEMGSGLTWVDDSVKVYVNSVDEATVLDTENYRVDSVQDNCDFEVTFNNDYLDTITDDTELIVTYSAILNGDAAISGEVNTNKTWLGYGDNKTTSSSTTKTETFKFQIVKTDEENKLIDGAQFELYTASTDGDPIKLVDKGDGSYRVATSSDEITTTTIVVKDGKAVVEGLDSDNNTKYYLKETQAPDGYNKLEGRQEVTMNRGNLLATLSENGDTWSDGGVHVVNKTGKELPSTGGMGTTALYAVGAVLVVGAGVTLVVRRRAHHEA